MLNALFQSATVGVLLILAATFLAVVPWYLPALVVMLFIGTRIGVSSWDRWCQPELRGSPGIDSVEQARKSHMATLRWHQRIWFYLFYPVDTYFNLTTVTWVREWAHKDACARAACAERGEAYVPPPLEYGDITMTKERYVFIMAWTWPFRLAFNVTMLAVIVAHVLTMLLAFGKRRRAAYPELPEAEVVKSAQAS